MPPEKIPSDKKISPMDAPEAETTQFERADSDNFGIAAVEVRKS